MTRPHVIWIDNYCKWLRVQSPTALSTMWRDTRWTVHGIYVSNEFRDADMSKYKIKRGAVVVPDIDELWAGKHAFVRVFKEVMKEVLVEGQPRFFEQSTSKEVNRLPLKFPGQEPDHDKYTFVPCAILQPDIGSNSGLAKVCAMFNTMYEDDVTNPIVTCTDINIWKRQMKVRESHPLGRCGVTGARSYMCARGRETVLFLSPIV